jgi:hypothetical protein
LRIQHFLHVTAADISADPEDNAIGTKSAVGKRPHGGDRHARARFGGRQGIPANYALQLDHWPKALSFSPGGGGRVAGTRAELLDREIVDQRSTHGIDDEADGLTPIVRQHLDRHESEIRVLRNVEPTPKECEP